MIYKEIISQVAEETGLSKHLVDRTYRAYWKAIRSYIKALPLNKELSDEEFLKQKPNINIPSIGKLYVTLDKYQRMKRQYAYYQNLKKNNYVTH